MLSLLLLPFVPLLSQWPGEEGGSSPAELEPSWKPHFEDPQRLRAGGEFVRVDEPGFACPSWIDLDGDGDSELVIGQLNEGRMRAYANLGDLSFGPGRWLQAEGEDIQTPGVW